MKSVCLAVMAVLCAGLAGCASIIKHEYAWNEYALAPGRVTAPAELGAGREIQVLKATSNDSTKMLGSVGHHEYFGSEAMLTEGLAYQLAKELQKLKFVVKEPAPKSLEIAVLRAGSQTGTWTIAASLDFTVKFGNGKVKTYFVRNSSPDTVPRALDGVVALAVMEILNDPEAISYINE